MSQKKKQPRRCPRGQTWGRDRIFTHPNGEKVCVIECCDLRSGDRIVIEESAEKKVPLFTAPLLAAAFTPMGPGMVEIYAVFEDGYVFKKTMSEAAFYIISASDA